MSTLVAIVVGIIAGLFYGLITDKEKHVKKSKNKR